MRDDDNSIKYNVKYFKARSQCKQGLTHDMNHLRLSVDVDADDMYGRVALQLEMENQYVPQKLVQTRPEVWVRSQRHQDAQKICSKVEIQKRLNWQTQYITRDHVNSNDTFSKLESNQQRQI